jgi:ABC-2 type transport system permease protein
MMVIAALLTSLTVAREWERGTMEQLISTPVTGLELILGKLVPYFSIGMFDFVVSILVGKYIFDVPLRGSPLLLLLLGSVFSSAHSLACWSASPPRASWWPTSRRSFLRSCPPLCCLVLSLPSATYHSSKSLPTVPPVLHGRDHDIYLKGVGLEVLWFDAVLLVVFAAVLLWFAKSRFKKSLD